MSIKSILITFFSLVPGFLLSQSINWTSNPFEHYVMVENQGQFDGKIAGKSSPIFYGTHSGGIAIYFTAQGVTYRYDKFDMKEGQGNKEAAESLLHPEVHYLNVEWKGANPSVNIIAEELQSFYYSFPDATDNFKTTIKAKCYKKITYKNLYPNIDVEYLLPEKGGVKYNLILHPGADLSKVKMRYTNAKGLTVDKNVGNIIIQTEFGNFVDHAPISFYADNKVPINSSFNLTGNEVTFNTHSYDKSKALIIDPWTSSPSFVASYNNAYDINYDLAGNIYVYGSFWPYQLAKFNGAGVLQWVFNATGLALGLYGDFAVDEVTGDSYLVEGSNMSTGAKVLKVNTSGSQTGLFLPGNTLFNEMWRCEYNQCTNQIVIGGGGTDGAYQAAMLDNSLTSLTPINVLGASTGYHDITLLAMDPADDFCYMLAARSFTIDPLNFDNTLIKCPIPALVPTNFAVNSNYTFVEIASIWYTSGQANGFNGMACGPTYLYTYDGSIIKKWNKNTGAFIAQVNTGGTMFSSGGLTLDACENVYAGVGSNIIKYNASLSQLASYPVPDLCYDLKLGPGNTLFACGKGFVSEISISGSEISISGCSINACDPLLPITLSSFTGSNEGNTNILEWQTASETNNDHFDIEKSVSGINFNQIGVTPGSGNTSKLSSYQFIDKYPLEDVTLSPSFLRVNSVEVYYRLKQVDYDGEYTYSNTISVQVNSASELPVIQQTNDYLVISMHHIAEQEAAIYLYIYDIIGREVYHERFKGLQEHKISLNSFESGIYHINIKVGPDSYREVYRQKVIIY